MQRLENADEHSFAFVNLSGLVNERELKEKATMHHTDARNAKLATHAPFCFLEENSTQNLTCL